MSNEPSDDRQFTDKEIQAILKRAGELQAARSEHGSGTLGGTTLAQLQQAAAEIGIDAELIAQAAQDLTVGKTSGQSSHLLGGPWRVDVDQWVPGAVTEETWSLLVDEIRAVTGRVGFPKSFGKGFEWLSVQPDPLHLTFSPSGDKTRLRITARFGGWSGLFYLLPTMLALVLALVLGATFGQSGSMSPGLFAALLMGLPVGTLAVGRMGFKRFCAKRRQQTYQLVDRLKQALTQPSPQGITTTPEVAEPEIVAAVSDRPVLSAPPPVTTEEPVLTVQSLHN